MVAPVWLIAIFGVRLICPQGAQSISAVAFTLLWVYVAVRSVIREGCSTRDTQVLNKLTAPLMHSCVIRYL
ncbi:uncharacterized protein B0T15DRAFT_540935 [Chaetomium strumarium]|uniref:Uncharacterized protein n=1 Tax=Chaetomium strumarium TaxID=1170767 RepID=A0AAJ0GPD5_9PEZI|nr:hypothetical protein B0T15DRAFT_540935 [Chaetomium strumarium]